MTNIKSETDTPGKLVLIAEDDDSNYFLMSVILKKAGFEAIRAEDGVQAVELCKTRNDISLVLMDMKMPHMNGLDATRQIKQLCPEMNVVAITAHAMSGDETSAINAGCIDYLAKPFKINDFLAKVLQYV
jgi:CheY-like chemotaxis protein